MPIPKNAIQIMHRPRCAGRPLLSNEGSGRFRINIDAIRVIAKHSPKAAGLRGFLSRRGRTLWLRPVPKLEDGDYHLIWLFRSNACDDRRHPWLSRISCMFQAPEIERSAGLLHLRLPMEWDAAGRAFRVDLPRGPITAPVYYDRPYAISVRLSTMRA